MKRTEVVLLTLPVEESVEPDLAREITNDANIENNESYM